MITIQKYEAVGIGLSIGMLAVALFIARFNGLLPSSEATHPGASEAAAVVVAAGDPAAVSAALKSAMTGGQVSKVVATDVTIGTGKEVKAGDTVTINYIATLQNGQEFDNSKKKGEPFTFTIGDKKVIPGLSQGLMGARAGGQRVIIIPSELAYGRDGYGSIPGNSTVVYAVELLSVK